MSDTTQETDPFDPSKRVHITPVNDLFNHILHPSCWCSPHVVEDGRVIVHNAADGRELSEAVDKINHSQSDPVSHPSHYTSHPSGVECIQIAEHMGFNLGNALKYIWRSDLKNNAIEDLKKAAWYIQREIEKREKELKQKEVTNVRRD